MTNVIAITKSDTFTTISPKLKNIKNKLKYLIDKIQGKVTKWTNSFSSTCIYCWVVKFTTKPHILKVLHMFCVKKS